MDSSVVRQKEKNNKTGRKKEERGQTEMKDRCKEKVENNKETEKL
jgi:hypothetical protein